MTAPGTGSGFDVPGGSATSAPTLGGSNVGVGSGFDVPGQAIAAAPAPSGNSGIWGAIKNLGSDVKGAVEGLPTGVAKVAGAIGHDVAVSVAHPERPIGPSWGDLFSHPLRASNAHGSKLFPIAADIGKSYETTYGPLAHGHFGQFAHELYAHPLGPILDAATIATLGGGGVAKAGKIVNDAGALSKGSKLAQLGKAVDIKVPDFGAGEDIVIKQSSRNPVVRLRQQATNDLLNKLPSETPVIGSTARGVRALTREPERVAARLQGTAQKASQSFGRLNPVERVAWHLKARGLTPEQYAGHLATIGEKAPPSVTRLLSDPRVSQLVKQPSENLRVALADGRVLSDSLTALRVAGGHIDETTALEAPYRHLRQVNGATYEPEVAPSPTLGAATLERDRIANAHENALSQEAAWRQATNASGIPESSNPHRDAVVTLGHAREVAQQHVDQLAGNTVKTGAVRLTDKPGRDLETLMREAGNEQPFYVPDSAHTSGLRSRFSSRPSGFSQPEQGVKQSRGVLFSRGLINFSDNSLARDYRGFASQARADLIHDELVKHAAIVPKGEPIPQGYEELKLNRGQTSAPYTARAAAPLEQELSGVTLRDRLAQLSRQHLAEANPEEPHTLVVPTQVRRMLEDNTRSYRSNLARATGIPQATNVWKHLILGLRPAFFANISVGNSILGALQMAPGRLGLVGWLNQVLPGAEKWFGPKLSAETMQEVFPEQAYGTFGHSLGYSPNAGLRTAQKAYQGVMPATIGYENVLRRAMAEGWAKADPEVQALMRRNGGDVNVALQQIAKSKPQIINGISRRVDDALGNYRTYNRVERAVKAVVPFYGWNRHLTASVVRLALERPQVLDALYQTGQEGKPLADAILSALPGYLAGSVGVHLPSWLGGEAGKEQLLTMNSLDPFNTLVDEGSLVGSLAGKPGAYTGAYPIHPLLQAAIEQMTGKNLLTGHDMPKSAGNAFVQEIEHATPQQAIIHDLIHGRHPSPTATNQNSEWGQILRLLGLPVENVNPGGVSQAVPASVAAGGGAGTGSGFEIPGG